MSKAEASTHRLPEDWEARVLSLAKRGRRATIVGAAPRSLAGWREHGFVDLELWDWASDGSDGDALVRVVRDAQSGVRLARHATAAELGLRLDDRAADLLVVHTRNQQHAERVVPALRRFLRERLVPGGAFVFIVPDSADGESAEGRLARWRNQLLWLSAADQIAQIDWPSHAGVVGRLSGAADAQAPGRQVMPMSDDPSTVSDRLQ